MKLTTALFVLATELVTASTLTREDANFDTLNHAVSSLLSPVPVPYKLLAFEGFGVGTSTAGNLALLASSFPNFAVAPNTTFALEGRQPVITTQYPGSKAKYFNLYSLATGCFVTTQNGEAAPPINCTLDFVGTKVGGAQVTKSFVFGVGTQDGIALHGETVKRTTFSGFDNLQSVSIAITKTPIPGISGVDVKAGFDDVMVAVWT